jgi:hypothetical protein
MLSKGWMIVQNEMEGSVKEGGCSLLYGVSTFVWRGCEKPLKLLDSILAEGRAGRLQNTSQASLIKTNCTVSLEVEICLSQRSSFFAVTNVQPVINDGQVKNSNEIFVGDFKVKLVLFENVRQSTESLVQSSYFVLKRSYSWFSNVPTNLHDAAYRTIW